MCLSVGPSVNLSFFHILQSVCSVCVGPMCLLFFICKVLFTCICFGFQVPSQNVIQGERFKENVTSCLLREITQECPSFPAQKMYSLLREKQEEEVIEEAGALITS